MQTSPASSQPGSATWTRRCTPRPTMYLTAHHGRAASKRDRLWKSGVPQDQARHISGKTAAEEEAIYTRDEIPNEEL